MGLYCSTCSSARLGPRMAKWCRYPGPIPLSLIHSQLPIPPSPHGASTSDPEKYTEKFGSHEPLLPLLCHHGGTHGREDKRDAPEQPPCRCSNTHKHTHTQVRAYTPNTLLHILSSHPPQAISKASQLRLWWGEWVFKRNALHKNPLDDEFSKETIWCMPLLHHVSSTTPTLHQPQVCVFSKEPKSEPHLGELMWRTHLLP